MRVSLKYRQAHDWIKKRLPLMYCSIDPSHTGKLGRANISREYKMEESDWIVLCCQCHKIFDLRKLTVKELKSRYAAKIALLASLGG